MVNLEELFYKCYAPLDKEVILELNNEEGPAELNNVIVGLEKHCFGILLIENAEKIIYRLFYVNGSKSLEGDRLELTNDNPDRDHLTFLFAHFLSQNYEGLDAINIFNTFQNQTRGFFEKLGYMTYNPQEFKSNHTTFYAKNVKGIIPVNLVKKEDFYKDFFGHKDSKQTKNGDEYVYLMINKRTDLIKIGQSKNLCYRERTLQSSEPEVFLISFWQAPKSIEKELHKQFAEKRQRGEWFKLTFKELEMIRLQMSIYETAKDQK